MIERNSITSPDEDWGRDGSVSVIDGNSITDIEPLSLVGSEKKDSGLFILVFPFELVRSVGFEPTTFGLSSFA
jgi:hypothetical protein